MPGGSGRPRRACPMCKAYKYEGNSKNRWKAAEADRRKRDRVEMSEARNRRYAVR